MKTIFLLTLVLFSSQSFSRQCSTGSSLIDKIKEVNELGAVCIISEYSKSDCDGVDNAYYEDMSPKCISEVYACYDSNGIVAKVEYNENWTGTWCGVEGFAKISR
jgi:hypothetical protein